MKPKPMGEVLRSAGWWLDHVERGGRESVDLLHHRLVDLIGCVVHREDCTPEEALDLLRGGYLFRAIENAINNENQPTRRRPAAASREQHDD
jgi:hypothetical protein